MYNSRVRLAFGLKSTFALLTILFLLVSCAKNINNKEAVKEAVMKRLSSVSGLNVEGMDVDISNVSFQGDTADATVVFKAKGSAEAMLNMSYKLERKDDVWIVKSSSGGMGGGGALPPGHAPAGGAPK